MTLKIFLWSSCNLCKWRDESNKYAVHNEIRNRLPSRHLHL